MVDKQIGSALEFLHNRYILHGDIKHDNILYENDSRCYYLTDFSLAMDMNTSKLDRSKQLYSVVCRPPILNYNDQIDNGLSLKKEYDYFALFMTLCRVHFAFLIGDVDSSLYEIVEKFDYFKNVEFHRILASTFKDCLKYEDRYVEAFRVCF